MTAATALITKTATHVAHISLGERTACGKVTSAFPLTVSGDHKGGTCQACEANAPTEELTATTTAARFVAVRAEGRYRVQDTTEGTYVAVAASRAKAEEKAAKLNAADAAELPEFHGKPIDTPAGHRWVADAPEVKAAVAQLQEELTANADAIGAALSEALPGEETPAAKPEADTKAYRIGKVLREWVTEDTSRISSALGTHIAGRNVCYDGTATLRLTPVWAAELAAAATELENAALSGEFQAKAPAVMAARAARKGLAKLF